MSRRPKQLIGVLGTHTEVGKTYVLSAWLAHLRTQGLRVAARKPVQSFDVRDACTDAQRLALASGEEVAVVCPPHRSYAVPLAPPMAADSLGRPRIGLNALLAEIAWPPDLDIGVVETVGGPRSPIAHDGDSVDLLSRLKPDRVLLVAEAGLGALNAVRLSLTVLRDFDVTVFLNRFDPDVEVHRLNREWLREKDRVRVVVDVRELARTPPRAIGPPPMT